MFYGFEINPLGFPQPGTVHIFAQEVDLTAWLAQTPMGRTACEDFTALRILSIGDPFVDHRVPPLVPLPLPHNENEMLGQGIDILRARMRAYRETPIAEVAVGDYTTSTMTYQLPWRIVAIIRDGSDYGVQTARHGTFWVSEGGTLPIKVQFDHCDLYDEALTRRGAAIEVYEDAHPDEDEPTPEYTALLTALDNIIAVIVAADAVANID